MAGESERDPDVLVNKGEIKAVLGIGEKVFRQYVAEGLPVEKLGKSFRGYRPQLVKWFAARTVPGQPNEN